jgi:LemA protein
VAVPLLGLLVSWAVTAYNRLRLLGQNLQRAESLVDVQLQRRHDLIPSLVEVVTAHAAHERTALDTATAAARTAVAATTPTDATEAGTQTVELRTVLARAEAYPELTADEAFLQLQRTLADTEGRIAGARTFYNDTLTLLRTRAGTFPTSIVARLVPDDHRELTSLEGFERTVPALDRDFG